MNRLIEENRVCQAYLMKQGFTRKLIERFLPAPELRPNPYSEDYPMMKTWDCSVVESVKENEIFRVEFEKAKKRSEAHKRGSKEKRGIALITDTG